MSKAYNRELTDPFQTKARGVPAFLRKKRYILLGIIFIAVVWVYTAHGDVSCLEAFSPIRILITTSLPFNFPDVGPHRRAVRTQEHELEDLLEFFVATPDQALPVDLDPAAELSQKSLRAAAGGIRAKVPPVVVFSKTYCPYSKRAKNLLASMGLEPEPFIVEVDLRDDSDTVKALLMKLTGHGTFPNVIIQRKTIGGSDDLARLHESGQLLELLGAAGVKAGVA